MYSKLYEKSGSEIAITGKSTRTVEKTEQKQYLWKAM
jgi:hypothetical protein